MKFWVRQKNSYDDDKCPCPGAKQEKGLCTSYGTWRTVEAAKKDGGKGWFFREGTFNHRKVKDGVAHDYYQDLWSMEFTSMEELMKFIEDHGPAQIDVNDDLYGHGPQIALGYSYD